MAPQGLKAYAEAAGQEKRLLALAMEGKPAGEGLQTMDEYDDVLSAMARGLVGKNRIRGPP